MRIDCALLCDAATAREGLLHILGAGIARAERESYPAPLGMALALRIMLHPTEADREHELRMVLMAEDGQSVAQATIGFGVTEADQAMPGEELAVSIPVPMYDLLLPKAGRYSFELLIDGMHQQSVPFVAG